MREIKFYFNDISIISKNETFISASIFNIKTLNKSRDCLLVFGLENHVSQIIQFSKIFDFITILQENNNTHVILTNNKILYEKLFRFRENLYKPKKIQLNAFIDLIGPVRRFAFPKKFNEYSKEFDIKMHLDDSNELIFSKEFNVNNNIELVKSEGKDFLIRFCTNLSYVEKIGINIRHISCAEINNTGISYSIGETHQTIRNFNIQQAMKLHSITEKDLKLYTAIYGLNQANISITLSQTLISLWSTIESIYSNNSKSLFNKKEQSTIVKFINENIDPEKAIIIKEQFPYLKKKTKNEIIIENILKLDNQLSKKEIDQNIKKASNLRGKYSHSSSVSVDEKEIRICNDNLKKYIKLFVDKKNISYD